MFSRHRWLALIGMLAATAPAMTQAQAYPTKPIRFLVPFAPGGSADVVARLLGASAGQALGQNLVIDNRPGSGGLIATQDTARANADGYTMILSSGAQMGIGPALHARAGYDPVKDFVHVIHLTDTPLVLIAHPALPVTGAKELIAYTQAQANRGKLNTASTGNGTYTHLTLELFKSLTGADLTHVPYKGAAPAINDLLGRQVQTMFTATASAQPYTASHRLKALGVTSSKRSASMPDVPTFAEQGVAGITVSAWNAISMPAGVASGIVSRVATEFAKTMQAPEVRTRLTMLGAEIVGVTGEPVARMVREDVARWSKVVKSAGVKVE